MQFKSLAFSMLIGAASVQAATLDSNPKAKAVVNRYADIVHATYSEALVDTKAMQSSIDAFLAKPSAETLEAAKSAWIKARKVWGQTEAFRFYEGPIDSTEGVEGFINAWPLDEAYIDYVVGAPQSGIINDPSTYPVIDEDSLLALNEAGSETNVATGYHAVEFLLWGQDLSVTGPGERPYTDFVIGSSASHVERRRAYLSAATSLLIRQIDILVKAWDPAGQDNYSASFRADVPTASLKKILTGLAMLLGDELAGERMYVAYDTQSQEDEHSCFSDTTSNDVIANIQSVVNVWTGDYNGVKGVGLDELVAEQAAPVAKNSNSLLLSALQAAKDLPTPYDSLIVAEADSELRKVFLETIFAVQDAGTGIEEAAASLGIAVSGKPAE